MNAYLLSNENFESYNVAYTNHIYQERLINMSIYLVSNETDDAYILSDRNFNYQAEEGVVNTWFLNLFDNFSEAAKQQLNSKIKNNLSAITCVYSGKTPFFTTIQLVVDGRATTLSTWAVKYPNVSEEDRVYVEVGDIETFFSNSDIAGLRQYLYNLFN